MLRHEFDENEFLQNINLFNQIVEEYEKKIHYRFHPDMRGYL